MITTLHEIFIFRVLVVKPELYPRVDENKVITETAETQSTNHQAANTVSQSVSQFNCLCQAETALPRGPFSNH